MTKYNFDEIIDRSGTDALKTDVLKERYGRSDLIPLWVADMDFLSPPEVIEAIIKRAKHGIFGYPVQSDAYFNSIINWVRKHHNWDIKQEWISFISGVVKGIAYSVDCFSSEENKVIIQPPVYYPFRTIPTLHNRKVIDNALILNGDQYTMNTVELKSLIDSSCKIFILCNPHNPGGRVWTYDELYEIAEICYNNNILVISDEIHSDLTFENQKHIPFASVSEKAKQNSITFMAPSKTFNIAGLSSSYAIIPNDKIRAKFQQYLKRSALDEGDIFAYLGAQIAYEKGDEWLRELKKYIWGNIKFVDNFLKENIPQIKAIIPQASFLIWLDCRKLNLSQKDLVSLFVNDAKLALNDGTMFGKGGEGFMRMNIGSPKLVLEQALINLKKAINNKH